jgi:hypothetical protein
VFLRELFIHFVRSFHFKVSLLHIPSVAKSPQTGRDVRGVIENRKEREKAKHLVVRFIRIWACEEALSH